MEDNERTELTIVALKQALRDRVAGITEEYESRIIELRLEITDLGNQLDDAREIIMRYQMSQPEPPVTIEEVPARQNGKAPRAARGPKRS